MSIYTLPPRALHRLACATTVALTLPWMTGCAGLQDTLNMSRREGKAPVVVAQIKPVTRLVEARNASDSEQLAVNEARPANAPSVITRALVPNDLRSQPTAAPQGDEEAREAAGLPTDPLRPDMTLNLDDINASTDLWVRVRRGFSLPALDSSLVSDHERWYASRPDYVQRMMERANRYLYHVLDEVERRNMPAELALLPFIESAFNPQAMSSARASGIWQFMPATGKDFELKQNLFRDDRRDVLASTRAALDYLTRLHRQFGDWHLALAAYNWGEGNVQRAINRNLKAGLPTDYLSLNMPPETRNYVPKLHAVRNIVQHPEVYGLNLAPIENHPYFVSVPIQRDMDVALAARLAQMPLADFQALNPSMNKPVILAAGTPQVLLPYNNASQFMHNLGQHRGPLASWTAWVVPKTMRPAEAARQVGMSESTLRELNHIPQRMLVKAGSTLLVPRSQYREQDVSENIADNAMMSLAPDLPPMRRMTLKAGKRDTVASIAKRYRVSAAQVAQWNKTSAGARFKRAQTVVVYVPVKASKRQLASAAKGKSKGSRVVASSARTKIKVASASKIRSSTRHGGIKSRTPIRQGKVRVASVSP
ncbi:MAG TPA: transglycosylase SLT domain-containing protein [Aquabacterium sp.]|uniref:transglycosylase SLT domain-containing protein n=1 Tax=Aquabacterium sp. TaxID=1872578 RepID=UPI002E378687|nr:transglycosylase SLT domain-containing protein [Aquabacterium sp.]HEX5372225.1 transglycosylase SLT domain-containing protein [Aquabacterium sp.]